MAESPSRKLDPWATVGSAGKPTVSETATGGEGSRDRFALLRLHATGGIGRVWLARDDNLGREIALKELRPEMSGNEEMGRRFLTEARVTGQLEHPGIVPVYELTGAREGVPPFYTMRFIRGRTLSESVQAYHKERAAGRADSLNQRALLTAFVGVCNAIAFAHSRGVIHRDLKGSNVVLGDYGEVMVLDWGLAKVLGEPDEAPVAQAGIAAGGKLSGSLPPVTVGGPASTDQTLPGHVLGTPAYMAPEQAEGRIDLIDARTDVYGLGAMLYEILTGRPPFVGDNVLEILRQVQQGTPARPRQVCAGVPPALEAISLRALAKRPADRYPTAEELAHDVQRWLADEPVYAYRDPLPARVARWGRRHRLLVSSAAALAAAALVALAVTTVLIDRERALTDVARHRAESHFNKARAAVDRFYTQVSETRLLNEPGLQPLRQELLRTALEYYQQLAQEQEADPALRDELGATRLRLAQITFESGTKESRPTAVALLEEAIRQSEALAAAQPQVTQHRLILARCYNSLGLFFQRMDQNSRAEKAWIEARKLMSRLADEDPDNPGHAALLATCLSNLGVLYAANRQWADAEDANNRALAIRTRLADAQPNDSIYQNHLADSYGNRGMLFVNMAQGKAKEPMRGYLDRAMKDMKQDLTIRQKLADENKDSLEFRENLAKSWNNLGQLQHNLWERPGDAEESFAKALAIRIDLAAKNPFVMSYQFELARTYDTLGDLLANLRPGLKDAAERKQTTERAEDSYRKALDIYKAQADRQGSSGDLAGNIGVSYTRLGDLFFDHRAADSLASYSQAIGFLETALRQNPESPEFQRRLRASYWGQADLLTQAGQSVKAIGSWKKALEHDRAPGDEELRKDAQKAADDVARGEDLSGEVLYDLACIYAHLTAAVPQGPGPNAAAARKQADELARQAVECLTRAHAAGYFANAERRQRLRTDPPLQSLQDRPAFQKFLRKLPSDQ